MKTQNQVRITNENARITDETVQHIGECIALSAIKKMMRFAHHPRSLDKLYAGLVEDIYGNRGYNTTFSDGYDLASEVICFLCHYMGHNLDDLACQNRKGELLTVLVTEKIDNFAGCGQVKVKGQFWSARGFYDDDVFECGESLRIVAIEGVMVVCKKN